MARKNADDVDCKPRVIRPMQPRRMICVGFAAHTGKKRNAREEIGKDKLEKSGHRWKDSV